MKVKVIHILNAVPILKELNQTKVKLSVSYKLKKIIQECNIVSSSFDDKNKELLTKYAVHDSKKDTFTFPKKAVAKSKAYQEAIDKIIQDTIDIEVPMLMAEEVEEYLNIEPSKLDIVEWFIKEVA